MNHTRTTLVNFEDLDLPDTVYKYRDWNNKWHKSIINERQVYMSAPMDFEDKLDCKNHIRYDLLTDDEIRWKYYMESKKDTSRAHLSEKEHEKFAEEWFQKSPLHDKERIKELQEQDFLAFNERTGILCLTANPIRPEMWVKYSREHTGFCVGFNPKIMFKYLGGGQEVIYCDPLPTIKPRPWDSLENQMIKQIYHKESKWAFEEEYRTQVFNIDPLTKEQRAVTLPIEAYKEIIFGAKISEKNKNEISSIAKKIIPHITFRQATLIEDLVKIES